MTTHVRTIVFTAGLLFSLGALAGQELQVIVSGTVRDPTGAVVPDASVEARRGDGFVVRTTTSDTGVFVLRVPVGKYSVRVSAPGFRTLSQEITASIGQTVALDIYIEAPVLINVSSDNPEAKPTWNVWTEQSKFSPLNTVPPEADFALVVELGAVPYSSDDKTFSKPISASLWTALDNAADSKDLRILVLHDPLFFDLLDQERRYQVVTVDVKKLKQVLRAGVSRQQDFFQLLRESDGKAPFSIARSRFRFRSLRRSGNTAFGISIWADGKPVDELSFQVCVGMASCDEREEAPTQSLKGLEAFSSHSGSQPHAALHFLQFDTSSVYGVFTCSACPEDAGQFYAWNTRRSPTQLQNALRQSLLQNFTNLDDSGIKNIGDDLFNLLFGGDDNGSGPAVKRFLRFVHQAKEGTRPILYVRLIPDNVDSMYFLPLGLMRLDGIDDFLGFRVRIDMPLEFQFVTRQKECIDRWNVLAPPRDDLHPYDEVQVLRSGVAEWLDAFAKWRGHAAIQTKLREFRQWLDSAPSPSREAVLVLSHHSDGRIFFRPDALEAITFASVRRTFQQPSFVFLAACGTAEPGDFEFLRQMNWRGVSAVIATSTKVEATMTGEFVSAFFNRLEQNKDSKTYTVADARFDAAKDIRPKYGAKSLLMLFAGDSSVRVCGPTKQPR